MKLTKIIPLTKGFLRGKIRIFRKSLISKSSLARNYMVRKNYAGSDSSYCYGIWMQQLSYWTTNNEGVPKVIVEIGSGNSLGVGLAALISGSEKFYSLEKTQYWNTSTNLRIFDELVALFKASGSNIKEDTNDQINLILSDAHMERCLSEARIDNIRQELNDPFNENNSYVRTIIPWKNSNVIDEESVDYVISHTVLQHVDDLTFAYASMGLWLRKGGCMAHTIDFKSMNATKFWNGHWTLSDKEWQIVTGGTSLINREPYSTYLKLLEKYKFKILHEKVIKSENKLKREDLDSKFQHLSDQDLTTSGWFYFAVRT